MIEFFRSVRARTMQIVAPLEIEDYVIQTAEFMSPPRWHIGHTSWFFETVLQAHQPGYKVYSEDYLFYFNSYYEGFGARIERTKRGTKSRPTVKDTVAYRNHVDEQMLKLLDSLDEQPAAETVLSLVRLGLEHEMQHQELLVYDIKHLLCDQYDAPMQPAPVSSVKVEGMAEIEGGLFCWLWAGRLGEVARPLGRALVKGHDRAGESGARPPHSKDSPSTTRSPRTRFSYRTTRSTAPWSAMATSLNSFAITGIKTFAGGFPKGGKLLTAKNGRRRSTGNCTMANG